MALLCSRYCNLDCLLRYPCHACIHILQLNWHAQQYVLQLLLLHGLPALSNPEFFQASMSLLKIVIRIKLHIMP